MAFFHNVDEQLIGSWTWVLGAITLLSACQAIALRVPDMGTKLLQLRLRLHEAEAFEAKASASASWLQNIKASTSASAS